MDEAGLFWSFHVPQLALAAAMYTLLGRFVLSLIFPGDSDKTIWRVFRQITAPVMAAAGAVTPAIVPERVVVLMAFVWLLLIRMAHFFLAVAYGFAPKVVTG